MSLRPPFSVRQIQVCTNLRDPALNRASCGANGGAALRERLKSAVKSAGRKGEIMVIGTSCLGYCPAQGCAVGIMPDHDWQILLPEDEPAFLTHIL